MARGQNNRAASQNDERLIINGIEANQQNVPIHMSTQLPTFDGISNNLEIFISQFNGLADLAKWPSATRATIIKTKLIARAQEFFSSDVTFHQETDYETVLAILREKFSTQKTISQIHTEYSSIKHKPGMSVGDLAHQIQTKAVAYLGKINKQDPDAVRNYDKVILCKLFETLRPDLRFEVLKNNPTSFDEALRIAKNIENAMQDTQVDVNTFKVEAEKAELALKIAEVDDLKRQLNNLQITQNSIICLFCGRQGHFAANCFKRAADEKRAYVANNTQQNARYRGQNFRSRGATGFTPQVPRTQNDWRQQGSTSRFPHSNVYNVGNNRGAHQSTYRGANRGAYRGSSNRGNFRGRTFHTSNASRENLN